MSLHIRPAKSYKSDTVPKLTTVNRPVQPCDKYGLYYYELGVRDTLGARDETELECFLRRGEDIVGGASRSGRYVVVRFAGPSLAHWALSVKISGWLECARRIDGRGTDASDDVILDRRRCECEWECVPEGV